MKFLLPVAGLNFIVDEQQLETIVNAVAGCKVITSKYVPSSGSTPSSYVDLMQDAPAKSFSVAVLTEDDLNALKFISSQISI
jgi:hypothetical protein